MTAKLPEMTAIPIMAMFLEKDSDTTWNDRFLDEDSETTWNDSYTYYGHISWAGQRNYLKCQLYLLWPCFLRITLKLPEMAVILIMAMFLEQNSETTWNDRSTYYGNISWRWQRNYLKWQLYLLWPYFLSRTAKLLEMSAIPFMAMFLEDNIETTWNGSYTYYGHVSGTEQRNYMKWQTYLLWQYFLTMTAILPEMTAIRVMVMFLEEDSFTAWNDSFTHDGHISWWEQRNSLKWQLYLLLPCFLSRTPKLHEITDLTIMAIFLEKDSETTWNESYTYYGNVS